MSSGRILEREVVYKKVKRKRKTIWKIKLKKLQKRWITGSKEFLFEIFVL